MSNLILDFSAHSSFEYCPAKWWETYINKRSKRWPPGLRDDALALGSLVHGGMEVWQQTHTVGIPQEIVDACTPSQTCIQLAQELIFGYTRAYPEEKWPLVVCEEPVLFPLADPNWNCPKCSGVPQVVIEKMGGIICGDCHTLMSPTSGITGLAKIDTYFYVPEVTTIPGGINGMELTLLPGWWIHEYKTKSPYISAALYMQSWETGMQASYQTLALRHKVQSLGLDGEVRGILINVMEKPRRHIPKRTCRACKEVSEFVMWLPTGTGAYQCPLCGNRQELTPLKEAPVQTPAVYYRVIVQREARQLAADREIMIQTGRRMLNMQANGIHSEPWTKGNCVNFQWKRACDYFQNHLSGTDTKEDPAFETRKDYRGLVVLE